MAKEKSECFEIVENRKDVRDIVTTFVVEVPVKDHKHPEIIDAKNKEVENLRDFDTFDEVVDEGQKKIGSRWVITKKESHDGQKTDYKARIVARGFQEEEKPQSDSPTAMRESIKIFLAVAANEELEIEAIDIKAAFLQSKVLDREVFVEPPKDLKQENTIWKLKKPLYGLDDASRKFWIRIKEILEGIQMKTIPGDEAFYYRHGNGKLEGMILTHVDDFQIAGTEKFLKEIRDELKTKLKVSKVERGKFRFTGVDIEKTAKGITISMEDYADSFEKMEEIRKASNDEPLTRTEFKVYRKFTGKISWLAANTRPDLAITALEMSKKNSSATIGDLKNINRVVEKIKSQPSRVEFTKIGRKEDLMIHGLTDASYKSDSKSISGQIIMLGNIKNKKTVPIYWKSRVIIKVCHSAKAAETRSMTALLDNIQFFAGQLEIILFGGRPVKFPIKVYTDSKPLLETIGSTHKVEEKLLRNCITDMKDVLYSGKINSYSWLDGRDMVADVLTKEAKPNDDLKDITIGNRFRKAFAEDNIVKCVEGEIKLLNPRNKSVQFEMENKSVQFLPKSANKVMHESNGATSDDRAWPGPLV